MAVNMPPGFGTRPGDRDHFEDPDPGTCERDPGPAPDPDSWHGLGGELD